MVVFAHGHHSLPPKACDFIQGHKAGLLAPDHHHSRLPGCPSDIWGTIPCYSGGAAPDFHRFPYSPLLQGHL